jgi:hypothetical protein
VEVPGVLSAEREMRWSGEGRVEFDGEATEGVAVRWRGVR